LTTVAQYTIDALSLAGLYAMVALGIAIVFGIMRLVNFAHGELIMLGGYALLVFSTMPWGIAGVAAVAAVVVLALLMERVAFRPVRGADAPTLLVTSFAVSYLLQNVVILATGARPKTIALPSVLSTAVEFGGLRVQALHLLTIALTIVTVIGLSAFLKYTAAGIQMRAAAEDFGMARLVGVRADRVVAIAFLVSGLLAGVVSLLIVAQSDVLTPTMGVQIALIGFVATVIGGMGSLVGAGLGGALLGILTVVLQATLPLQVRSFRDAFAFMIVIGLLLIRPQGILGSPTLRV
jgi:branched-chain amino acid transport system permease protein